ncbi:LOW QUALITY PROTEIN: hypothetical protein U9M48_011523, partial [Paspalum notatum var. saurae]
MERLEMAVSELELALERSTKLPITDVPLLQRRKKIKCAYVQAMELLDKHKQQAVPANQEEIMIISQGVKQSKRWIIPAKNVAVKYLAMLNTDDVRRFEWYADCAGKFVRDVESGCSLRHNTFCNPIVRYLIEGKTLMYHLEQGTQLRRFYIWPTCSEERGVEVVLEYHYKNSTITEKCFKSTDIVRITIRCLQFLASQFKPAAESATGELTLLPNLLLAQDITHSFVTPFDSIQEFHTEYSQVCRPDPACCKSSRHRFSASNGVSSELPYIFPEQVTYLDFKCHYIPALEPRWRRLRSSPDEVDRSVSKGWTSPLEVTVGLLPHYAAQDAYAVEGRDWLSSNPSLSVRAWLLRAWLHRNGIEIRISAWLW